MSRCRSCVPFALAGDEPDFLAAVAVRHLAAECRLDHRALVVEQHHRGGDDAAGPQVADAVLLEIARQHVERVRMSEQHFRVLRAPAGDEVLDGAVVEVDRVEIHEAIDQQAPQALLERPCHRRVAPQCRDLHAVKGAGPLVRAHGVRGARLEPVRVEVGRKGNAGRAAGLVLAELRAGERARQHLIGRGADDGLGQKRQARERGGVEGAGIEPLLAEQPLIVGRVHRGVAQDRLQALALARLQHLKGQPLGALKFAQAPQPAAAVL